ncbi:MAG: OsmC family protein [bacterium]
MNDEKKSEKKYKPHMFKGNLTWLKDRKWELDGENGPLIPGGPPPIFNGEEGRWTPEELLLQSVNTCQLSTFTSIAQWKKFNLLAYESEVEGHLEHDGTNYKFVKIIIRPKITVASEEDVKVAEEITEKAHKNCWMGYSVKAEIIVEPEIIVG